MHRKLKMKNENASRDRGKRFYDKRLWRDRIRPAQLRREPLCEACLMKGKTVLATDVDHIDGNPYDNDEENLQSLCHECHSRKTVNEDGGFGNS